MSDDSEEFRSGSEMDEDSDAEYMDEDDDGDYGFAGAEEVASVPKVRLI
jgi:ariadne-1